MNCLKCGRETQENHVFCQACQEIMRNYPVKPGTVIHLPDRDVSAPERKAPPEPWEDRTDDDLVKLRRLTHWLTATIALLSLLLCIATGMLIHTLSLDDTSSVIGRNYTTAQDK